MGRDTEAAQGLETARQSIPLPGQPAAPAPPRQQAPVDMQSAMAAAKGFQMPNLGSLTRPTERPNEPVHAGLPGSPVPGSPPQQQGPTLSSTLSAVASAAGSPALNQLAQEAEGAGQ